MLRCAPYLDQDTFIITFDHLTLSQTAPSVITSYESPSALLRSRGGLVQTQEATSYGSSTCLIKLVILKTHLFSIPRSLLSTKRYHVDRNCDALPNTCGTQERHVASYHSRRVVPLHDAIRSNLNEREFQTT